MVADALAGKIELIVTKSVSRFARNTVDSLTTIRKLKEQGVEVYFQKESIWTFDSKGELLLTIMSSLAQEESRSISENVTWSVRKRFADGKVSVPYSCFLGYDKGPSGKLVINREEAKTVVLIYQLFLNGKTPEAIAKRLTELGIPTPRKGKKWCSSTITSILTNEKYKGDALLQKTFTVDFLSKQKKTNSGEIPQYYIEGNHEAIISPEEFDLVQAEMARRKKHGRSISTISPFASKIICSDCGCFYGQKVWHSNDKYRRVIWRCNHKFDGEKKCATPTIDEETIRQNFLTAYRQLESCREQVLSDVRDAVSMMTDTGMLDEQIASCEQELEELAHLMRAEIQDNASRANQQETFDARFADLQSRYAAAERVLNGYKQKRADQLTRQKQIARFLKDFESSENSGDWDETLWLRTVESVTVNPDGSMDFLFLNGQHIIIS